MANKNSVDQAIKTAFKLLASFGEEMTFVSKGAESYNPSTGEVESGGGASFKAIGFILKTYTDVSEDIGGIPLVKSDVFFNRQDLEETGFEQYDELTFNGKTHPIISFQDDGYSVTFTVSVR